MSLITTSSQGQKPYDYTAKFPSGVVKIPRNGKIGLLNASFQKWNLISVDDSNDTCMLSFGRSNLILQSEAGNSFENQIDWLPPQLIRIAHNNYNPLLPKQTTSATSGYSNTDGAQSLIAELQDKINEASKKYGYIFDGDVDLSGASGFLKMSGARRDLTNNANLLVELDYFNLVQNTADATITQNTASPNVGAVVRPSVGSDTFISKYPMAFGAQLDDLGFQKCIFQLEWEIPVGASTDRFNKFQGGSFYGLCLESQVDTTKFRAENSPILQDNTDGSVVPNMPIVIRFGNEAQPQIFIDVYNIDQNSNGENVLGSLMATLTHANAIMDNTSGGGGRKTKITLLAEHNNKQFRLKASYNANDVPATQTDLTRIGSADAFIVLDSQFFHQNMYWIGKQPKDPTDATNIDFKLNGKDLQIGMSEGASAEDIAIKGGGDGNNTALLHFGALQPNAIIDMGLDQLGGNAVFGIPDAHYLAMTSQCNMNYMLTIPNEANVRGGTTYKYMIGRDSRQTNGQWVMGLPMEGDDYAVNSHKINITNLGLSSFRGDHSNGAVDRCLYAGFGKYPNVPNNNQTGILRIEPNEVMMVDVGNKEPMDLNYLRFTITNFDNELSTELQGTSYVNLVIKEGKNQIRQTSNVMSIDMTEKLVEYERKPY